MQQKTINYFDINDIPLCDESFSEIVNKFDPDYMVTMDIDIALIKVSSIIKVITDSEDLDFLRGQMKSFGNFWVKID